MPLGDAQHRERIAEPARHHRERERIGRLAAREELDLERVQPRFDLGVSDRGPTAYGDR